MRKLYSTLIFDITLIFLPLFILIWMFASHSPKEFASIIMEFNFSLQWSEKWWGLYAIYFFEILSIIFLWDFLVLSRLFNVVYSIYNELTERFIRKRWLLIKLIRFNYGFQKIYYHLKLLRSSSKSEHKLIDNLTAPIFTDWIKFFYNLFTSAYSILAAVLTIITFDYSAIHLGIESIKGQWDNLYYPLWNNFSKLSALVVFVLLIFLLYFVSSYGVTRRAIAQANKRKLEEVIQLFRKLEEPVLNIIFKGAENLQYAMNCYDSIYEYWTLNKFKTNSIANQKSPANLRRLDADEDFLFANIHELEDLIEILEEINNSENRMYGSWFSSYRFELRKLISITKFRKLEYYERVLFTKKGFNRMSNANKHQSFMIVEEENLREDFAFNQTKLNSNIIDGLELLYAFHRYIKVSNKILHMDSDRLGRGIRLFTGKE